MADTGRKRPSLGDIPGHILERIDDHEEVELLRDGEGSRAVVGALRGESVEVTFAPWLVDRLLDEGVVLSWRMQRQLLCPSATPLD
jgi:hypothetical protein